MKPKEEEVDKGSPKPSVGEELFGVHLKREEEEQKVQRRESLEEEKMLALTSPKKSVGEELYEGELKMRAER